MSATERPAARAVDSIASTTAGPPLADTIARLRRAMRRAARAFDPGNPLAVAQLELLSAVADEPGVRPGRLARRLRIAPNSVTTLVNGLYARGLISRAPGETDARVVHLDLTADGHQAVDAWKSANASIIESALAALAERHRDALSEALPALRELTQAVDALADSPVRDAGGAGPAPPRARR